MTERIIDKLAPEKHTECSGCAARAGNMCGVALMEVRLRRTPTDKEIMNILNVREIVENCPNDYSLGQERK